MKSTWMAVNKRQKKGSPFKDQPLTVMRMWWWITHCSVVLVLQSQARGHLCLAHKDASLLTKTSQVLTLVFFLSCFCCCWSFRLPAGTKRFFGLCVASDARDRQRQMEKCHFIYNFSFSRFSCSEISATCVGGRGNRIFLSVDGIVWVEERQGSFLRGMYKTVLKYFP